MVQVFLNSASDSHASLPIVLAQGVSSVVGDAWPIFAPLIRAMGAFVAGSNTVSNMMFSLFQCSTAEQIGLAAAGAGTVGLADRKHAIIRETLIPMAIPWCRAG
ncbi:MULTISPECIES: L-lactate permease [unclassified Paracoccus (in: a-proteobacteria)]|uniref:L-lactate permease n=1 Tax=unclassified Paracoccus (in: a-proteobacteria) TaxID=2688777 RepID=UPI000225F146|nr:MULTISPECIES: L-lactate permease [unclassified Paracoccus (in: a-proteobacteria)]SMG53905.1 L-lactate permease [Paracoccus sp. J56]